MKTKSKTIALEDNSNHEVAGRSAMAGETSSGVFYLAYSRARFLDPKSGDPDHLPVG